jgi:hypothetical protein
LPILVRSREPDDFEILRRRPSLLYLCNSAGRLVSVNEVFGERPRAPVAYLCHSQGVVVHAVRDDVPLIESQHLAVVLSSCRLLSIGQSMTLETLLCETLRNFIPVSIDYSGPIYRFPSLLPKPSGVILVTHANAHLLKGCFDDLIDGLDAIQPCAARIVDDRAVSVCRTVRYSDDDLEAGVDTLSRYRQHGYRADVVASWATLVRKQGRNPLYSTSWKNTASIALARKLKLIAIGVDISAA